MNIRRFFKRGRQIITVGGEKKFTTSLINFERFYVGVFVPQTYEHVTFHFQFNNFEEMK